MGPCGQIIVDEKWPAILIEEVKHLHRNEIRPRAFPELSILPSVLAPPVDKSYSVRSYARCGHFGEQRKRITHMHMQNQSTEPSDDEVITRTPFFSSLFPGRGIGKVTKRSTLKHNPICC